MTSEREQTPWELDPAAMARALHCAARPRPDGAVDFELRNEALNISFKLSVDQSRRTVSIYLRGPSAFLGFVHMTGVDEARVDERKGEVWFLSADGEKLAVHEVGVFLLTSRAVYASADLMQST